MLRNCKILLYLHHRNPLNLKIMKKSLIIIATLITGLLTAQNVKPVYEKVDNDNIKGTFFHDNGKIQQQGLYKKGKLHGKWVSYNAQGNKVAEGTYENGAKVGTWFFYDGKTLSEINYNKNVIASIKTWDENSNVVANFKK